MVTFSEHTFTGMSKGSPFSGLDPRVIELGFRKEERRTVSRCLPFSTTARYHRFSRRHDDREDVT